MQLALTTRDSDIHDEGSICAIRLSDAILSGVGGGVGAGGGEGVGFGRGVGGGVGIGAGFGDGVVCSWQPSVNAAGSKIDTIIVNTIIRFFIRLPAS